MKGKMDVLNISTKSSGIRDVIRIETDDEREKELRIGTRNREMEVDIMQPCAANMSDFEDVEMDDDDEDEVVSSLPVLSVIVKDEANNAMLPKMRPEVEIKYEDDIEEEEYDSEDSVNIREMPSLSSRPGVESPNPVRTRKQITHKKQTGNLDASLLDSEYLDRSIFAFDSNSSTEERVPINGSMGGVSLNGSVRKTNDSVLLSIVYATINVPFSQVSKFLTAYNLSKSQLSVIRKVRRQVKNRLYAQNCRRRRIAHIKNLADELKQMRTEKERMCSLRAELLAKKGVMQKRYSKLYDHIIGIVKERCRNENYDYVCDANDEEELKEIQEELNDERETLEERKKNLEAGCHNLYVHIFKVISDRNSENRFTKNNEENPFNIQLRNMNIVNELAMLNKYYAKNNVLSHEADDQESSASGDGSRTSENKMSDFVDYEESSISVDGSRTEENTRDDFVEYESGMNDEISDRTNVAGERNSKVVTTALISGNIHEIEDIRLVDENSIDSQMNVDEKGPTAWPENSEEEEEDSEDDEENISQEVKELRCTQDDLKEKKEVVRIRYAKLYDHVLKVVGMNEAEFLKTFMDYCITLLLKMPDEN